MVSATFHSNENELLNNFVNAVKSFKQEQNSLANENVNDIKDD